MSEKLKALQQSLVAKQTFEPGQIVVWKDGLKNKRTEGPFVVVEVLDQPLVDPTQEVGAQYFREPLDVILGAVVSDAFVCYHFDSRRFQLAE